MITYNHFCKLGLYTMILLHFIVAFFMFPLTVSCIRVHDSVLEFHTHYTS